MLLAVRRLCGQLGPETFAAAWIVCGTGIGAQWLAFIPSYLSRTEHFYDLMGSITYIMDAAHAAGNYDPQFITVWS